MSEIGLNLEKFNFNTPGKIPYKECIALIKQASVTLIFRPSDLNYALGTKVFDYIHSDAPILGILENENETAKFIRKASLGIVVPNNSQAILDALNKLANGEAFQRNWNFLKKFNRRELTRKLAKYFDKIMEVAT